MLLISNTYFDEYNSSIQLDSIKISTFLEKRNEDLEKYYWDNRAIYYENISLGYSYYSLFWQRSLPFLQMLSKAFNEYELNK